MFPTADSAGRIIAFSSRVLPVEHNPEYTNDAAKYINSPDTALYNKSHVLYGYDKAKQAIRKANFAIVVEGQMDVVLSHQGGYPNTVAVSGTAMTETQLKMLDRLSHNVVLAFDADQSGVTSSGRTAELALAMGMNVKVAPLPHGVDPADLVSRGADEWRAVVRKSKHIVDFYLDYLTETVRDTRTLRLEVGRRVLPYIALIPNRIDQAHFVSIIASRLGIGEEPIFEELSKITIARSASEEEQAKHADKRAQATTFDNLTERRLFGILIWQRAEKGCDIDVKVLEKQLSGLCGEKRFAELEVLAKEEGERLLFEIEQLYQDAHTLAADIDEMLTQARRNDLINKRQLILGQLHRAEQENDAQTVSKLMERYAELTKELEELSLPEIS